MDLEAARRSIDHSGRQDAAKKYGDFCNHHHHVAIVNSGHLLTRSVLTHPEVSSMVWFLLPFGSSLFLLSWSVCYVAFC